MASDPSERDSKDVDHLRRLRKVTVGVAVGIWGAALVGVGLVVWAVINITA